MTRIFSTLMLLAVIATCVACSGEKKDKNASTNGEKHDHDEHEGKDEHGDGERHEVGNAKIGEASVTVAVLGEIEAGKEAALDVEIEGGTVAAVRAWIGIESGSGSLRAKLEGEGGEFHAHVETPMPLPDGSAIWIEIEDGSGNANKASFKLP